MQLQILESLTEVFDFTSSFMYYYLFQYYYISASAATWGSGHDSDNNSSHSSVVTSSDESFLAAEADFASAVAKAAEMSGLTVVGSTVSDPKAGKDQGILKDRK